MAEKYEKRKRYRFLLSSFSSDEKAQLANAIRTLGGTYIDSPHFMSSCTHIVCGKPNRGEKFLSGCASGKWILRISFIQDSLKANKWMDEDAYEWTEHQCEEELPIAHLSAPGRWRKFLKLGGAPYKDWKAIVVVRDAKKRTAYKRLLEVGGAKLVNGKLPFSATQADKLTHVFVDNTQVKDIQSLKERGIPCLSTDYIPEFILQDPSPAADLFSISTYSQPTNCQDTNMTRKCNKNIASVTPVLCLRSISVTAQSTKELKIEGKIAKEKEEASSPVKQMKQETGHIEPTCVNKVPPGLLFHQGIHNTKTKKPPFQLPSYITDIVESCLEENHVMSALSTLGSYMSHQRYPTAALLHTIMDDLILKSPSPTQANKANLLLQRLLVVHPPNANTALYRSALCSAKLYNGQVQHGSTEWEYVKKVVRLSLDEPEEPEDAAYSSYGSTNSMLLLNFLLILFERDFCGHRDDKNTSGSAAAPVCRYRKTLLWQMFWPRGSIVTFNRSIREMVNVTWSAITCTREKPAKIQVVHALQRLLSVVAECCFMADGLSSAVGLGEITRTLITELTLVCSGTHRDEEDVRLLLETIQPVWLRMHLADSLLRNYDTAVVPEESKYLLNRPLSIKKIVQYYFFLLPRERVGDRAQTTDRTHSLGALQRGKKRCASPLKLIRDGNHPDGFKNSLRDEYRQAKRPKKAGVNRRNVKGETQLHVACIKNDVSKVQQLLSNGADVNLTDYAGWTALHEACNHGHVACLKEILLARPLTYGNDEIKGAENVNILAAPLDGTTALHDAAINNHLSVAQLLVTHGGLCTLEAKNAKGLKSVEVAVDSKMKEFLETAELNIRNNSTDMIIENNSNSTHTSKDTVVLCPSEDAYQGALGRKGRRAKDHVPPQKCEEFLLILSHLVQSYVSQSGAAVSELKQSRQFMDLTESLELHIERIIAQSTITPLCRLRLQGMTWWFARPAWESP